MAKKEQKQAEAGLVGAEGTSLPPFQPCEVVEVPITDINLDHPQCDYRVEPKDGTILVSLEKHGQQMPAILWGASAPYEIVNGHRRIRALKQMGKTHVVAIIRQDITTTEQAHTLAFIEDDQRLPLDAIDRANLVRRLEEMGKSRQYIKDLLGIEDTTLKDIKRVQKMDDYLRDQLKAGAINMRHSQLLFKYGDKLGLDYSEWVAKAKVGMSSRVMATELKELAKARKAETKTEILKAAKKGKGFSLRVKVGKDTPPEEKDEILKALDEAKELINQTEGEEADDSSKDNETDKAA